MAIAVPKRAARRPIETSRRQSEPRSRRRRLRSTAAARLAIVRCVGLRPLHRLLLRVMLDEVAGLAAELEHRDLALAAIAEAERHHRGADAGADVDRARGLVAGALAGVAARSVEAVDVAMAARSCRPRTRAAARA